MAHETLDVEYEVEQRGNTLRIRIEAPELRKPLNHSASLQTAQRHPDGVEGFIEEKVDTLVHREVKAQEAREQEEIPSGGTLSVDPNDPRNERVGEPDEPEDAEEE
jgi:hypothetical protein